MGALKVWDGAAWQIVSQTGSQTYVGPSAPPDPPNSGDLWYDTDDTNQLVLPLRVIDGGTGATDAATARTNLGTSADGGSASVVGAPTTGVWARGDTWFDSSGVLWTCTAAGTPGTWKSMSPGEELAYNQITTGVSVTATAAASATLVIDGTSRSYDGSPVKVEFMTAQLQSGAGQTYINLWDGPTDLGYLLTLIASTYTPVSASRRITPTVGTHNYRIVGWVAAGGGAFVNAGTGAGSGLWCPAYVRVTRA